MTILFISHKLGEVRALAERVTVLRSGRYSGTELLADVPDDRIMQMVMGSAVDIPPRRGRKIGAPVIEAEDMSTTSSVAGEHIENLSFRIGAGEILGVAGVDGSGQEGLVGALTGTLETTGTVRLGGADMGGRKTAAWRRAGMAHLPADRFTRGGAPGMSLSENAVAGMTLPADLRRGPFLRPSAIARRAHQIVRDFSVRCLGIDEPLDSLSGGNAQKVIAARELATEPKFLIADQPTRGIDVAAAAFLHRRFGDLADRGGAILLITADLDELLRLSDRILVMFNGRVTAEIANGPDVTPATLGPFMLGLEKHT